MNGTQALAAYDAVVAVVVEGAVLIAASAAVYFLIVLPVAVLLGLVLRHAARRQPVTVYCLPCNGEPGPCTCKAKADCEHPLCGAADTGVLDIDAEWAELMRREGGSRG